MVWSLATVAQAGGGGAGPDLCRPLPVTEQRSCTVTGGTVDDALLAAHPKLRALVEVARAPGARVVWSGCAGTPRSVALVGADGAVAHTGHADPTAASFQLEWGWGQETPLPLATAARLTWVEEALAIDAEVVTAPRAGHTTRRAATLQCAPAPRTRVGALSAPDGWVVEGTEGRVVVRPPGMLPASVTWRRTDEEACTPPAASPLGEPQTEFVVAEVRWAVSGSWTGCRNSTPPVWSACAVRGGVRYEVTDLFPADCRSEGRSGVLDVVSAMTPTTP